MRTIYTHILKVGPKTLLVNSKSGRMQSGYSSEYWIERIVLEIIGWLLVRG